MFKTTVTHLFALLLLIILLLQVKADCGCGSRCMKYSSDLQCGRCCTATVRRSVPFLNNEPDQPQQEEDNLVQKFQTTRKRSLAELSSILSLLEQKERRTSSHRLRSELHRTRKRLEKYGLVKYGDLIDQANNDTNRKQFNEDEREMYDVLERIINRMVQQHQNDDLESRLEKRSSGFRRTSDQRLSQLFKL